MKILLTTHSSNEHYNADMDYAVVEITPELARRILEYCKLADAIIQGNDRFCSVVFYDPSPQYFEWCEEIEEITSREQIYDDTWICDRDIPEEYRKSTDYDSIVINGSGLVYWRSAPRRGDCLVETTYLEPDILKAVIETAAA